MKKLLFGNKLVQNASWIVGCKLAQSFLSLAIGLFTARYLGPSNYGIINYAASLTAFAMPIMQLGFNEILVQEIINNPAEEGKVLGTALGLSICAGIMSVVGVFAFSLVANAGDYETTLVCVFYSVSLIFQATEMLKYWFQAKLLSKYTSITALIAHMLVAVYKIYILIVGKSVLWFAITHAIEATIISIILLFLYVRNSNQKLLFSLSFGKRMFSISKHYISSGLMIAVFQQTDKIMLKFLMSETEVGFYSSATTCIAITGFVFTAIIDTARPWVIEGKGVSEKAFNDRLRVLFSIIFYISLLQSLSMTLLAEPLVYILFGKAYFPTVGVLRIAVWYVAFGYMGTVRNIWILTNHQQRYLPIINLSGALLNVVGNILLIPVFGAQGAALASFLTQLFSNFLLCFIIKPIRNTGKLILESMNPRIIKQMIVGNFRQHE